MSTKGNMTAQYLAHGDPALKGYYPAWVNNLADDATVEGSMLDGVVQREDAVRSVGKRLGTACERCSFSSTSHPNASNSLPPSSRLAN